MSLDSLPKVPIKKELGEYVVKVEHIVKEYELAGRDETVQALANIHLGQDSEFYPIRRGEFVMLRGPSGGGKTSLLNILGTIDKPSSGRVEILGTTIDEASSDAYMASLRLAKIGFVFQTFNLLATMSAFENVELPMTVLGTLGAKERKRRAKELLTAVGLRDRMKHLPSELSGGEQQRVTIARALANEPEILLLDEPTGDLDTKNTIEIMDLLLDINQRKGTTCIMVTHNPDIECYADRLLYVSDGQFIRQALNYEQSRLNFAHYVKYLNSQDQHESRF
jgi:putative ABC transport system ATP-binding protein